MKRLAAALLASIALALQPAYVPAYGQTAADSARMAIGSSNIGLYSFGGLTGLGYFDGTSAKPKSVPIGLVELPHVANNAALTLLPPTIGRVRRETFATGGAPAPDGGAADYQTTATACTLNSGAGDGGSQVGLIGPNGTAGTYVGCANADLGFLSAVPMSLWGVTPDSNGTTGNGTDNTTRVLASVAWSLLTGKEVDIPTAPTGKYVRVTGPISITGHVNIGGAYCAPYGGGPGVANVILAPGAGSWLYEDQTGNGFVAGSTNGTAGYVLHDFCMIWNQPTPPTVKATYSGYIAAGGTTLTVTSVSSGTLATNDLVIDTGTNDVPGTQIASQASGTTGGTGVYNLSTTAPISIGTSASPVTINDYVYWAPNANDYGIVQNNDDGRIDNIFMLNPTLGIKVAGGRGLFRNVRGQFLQRFLYVDGSQDVLRVEDTHDWPFYSQNAAVFNYMYAKKEHLYTARADAIKIFQDYIIGGNSCWHIGTNAGGDTTYGGNATDMACDDFGGTGLLVDGASNGANTQLINFTYGGHGAAGSSGAAIDVETGGLVQGINIGIGGVAGSVVKLNKSNARSSLINLSLTGWGKVTATSPAISAIAATYVNINGYMPVLQPPASPVIFSATGTILHDGVDPRSNLSVASGVDGSQSPPIFIPAGATQALPAFSGGAVLQDLTTGQVAPIVVGGSGGIGIGAQTGSEFVVTASPSTSQTGLAYNGSYVLINGFTATHKYIVTYITTRSVN